MDKIMKAMLLISVISLIPSVTYAKPFIDSVGFDVQYSSTLPNVVESKSHKHRATRYIARAGKRLSEHWELDGEFHYSYCSSSPRRSSEQRYRAKETGVNLAIHYNLGNRSWIADPYVGWMAGLSWLVNKRDQPNWAESGCLGSWGPMIGLSIPVSPRTDLRIEGRISHTSDPFGGDSGRNLRGIAVGLSYYF